MWFPHFFPGSNNRILDQLNKLNYNSVVFLCRTQEGAPEVSGQMDHKPQPGDFLDTNTTSKISTITWIAQNQTDLSILTPGTRRRLGLLSERQLRARGEQEQGMTERVVLEPSEKVSEDWKVLQEKAFNRENIKKFSSSWDTRLLSTLV